MPPEATSAECSPHLRTDSSGEDGFVSAVLTCGRRPFTNSSHGFNSQSIHTDAIQAGHEYQRRSEAIRVPYPWRHQRSSEVIRGHQRRSEFLTLGVIRGHQRSSEVIRGDPSSLPLAACAACLAARRDAISPELRRGSSVGGTFSRSYLSREAIRRDAISSSEGSSGAHRGTFGGSYFWHWRGSPRSRPSSRT